MYSRLRLRRQLHLRRQLWVRQRVLLLFEQDAGGRRGQVRRQLLDRRTAVAWPVPCDVASTSPCGRRSRIERYWEEYLRLDESQRRTEARKGSLYFLVPFFVIMALVLCLAYLDV